MLNKLVVSSSELSLDGLFIKREVKLQDVYVRFAENTELARLNVALDKGADLIFAEAAHSCDSRYLEQCRGGSDVRVKAGARSGDEINWNRSLGIVSLRGGCVALYAVD